MRCPNGGASDRVVPRHEKRGLTWPLGSGRAEKPWQSRSCICTRQRQGLDGCLSPQIAVHVPRRHSLGERKHEAGHPGSWRQACGGVQERLPQCRLLVSNPIGQKGHRVRSDLSNGGSGVRAFGKRRLVVSENKNPFAEPPPFVSRLAVLKS